VDFCTNYGRFEQCKGDIGHAIVQESSIDEAHCPFYIAMLDGIQYRRAEGILNAMKVR